MSNKSGTTLQQVAKDMCKTTAYGEKKSIFIHLYIYLQTGSRRDQISLEIMLRNLKTGVEKEGSGL